MKILWRPALMAVAILAGLASARAEDATMAPSPPPGAGTIEIPRSSQPQPGHHPHTNTEVFIPSRHHKPRAVPPPDHGTASPAENAKQQ